MPDPVQLEHEGPVAVVRLARPDRNNAIDSEVWTLLRKTALQLSDAPPKAVIVTGGSCFSVGLDLTLENTLIQHMERRARAGDAYGLQEVLRRIQNGIDAYSRIPCPVIAAIEGPCLGVGLELALACDLRVAAQDAVFGFPDIRNGMSPISGGLVRTARFAGHARAKELILTGRSIDAPTAATWGLLNRVCAPGEALSTAQDLAGAIGEASAEAVKQALLTMRKIAGSTEDFVLETNAAARSIASGDLTEAVLANLDVAPPSPAE